MTLFFETIKHISDKILERHREISLKLFLERLQQDVNIVQHCFALLGESKTQSF